MAYNLQTSQVGFTGGINILASEHVQFIEVGGTMDATAFETGVVPIGTLVARNSSSGKFEPYAGDGEGGALPAGYEDFGVLNIDFVNDGENDTIVGEIIIRGSVYVDKIPTAPTPAFREANDNIRYIPAR